jgi:hypothetical protein
MAASPAFLRWLLRWFDRLAARPALALILVGLLAFVGSATVAAVRGVPEPRVHDEFGYLLAADTFAHGRLTNPPHPMWTHFETIHVIHQPSYASKFPPAQGLVLALGQVIGGHPVVGLWLSVGLMSAAIAWMLFAWLPPRWALLGALLVVLRLGLVDYWAQSYWGGAIAAAGGGLVFGGLRRMIPRPRARDSILFAIGLAMLANSRPYEGLMATVLAVGVIAVWLFGPRRPSLTTAIRQVIVPAAAVLTVTAAAMVYYNVRVTGRPFTLPYQVHASTYRMEPVFLWQSPNPPPEYRHKELRDFHAGFEMRLYQNQHPIGRYGFRSVKLDQFKQLWGFLIGPALTIPLIVLPWLVRDRWMRFALATCAVVAAGLMFETWVLRHYAAPVTGLIFVLVLGSLQFWHASRAALTRVLVTSLVALVIVLDLAWVVTEAGQRHDQSWPTARVQVVEQLLASPERDLVIVRYGPRHDVQQEWVYNAADIDASPIVWARHMEDNQELIDYFTDRRVWYVDVDAASVAPVLTEYLRQPLAR